MGLNIISVCFLALATPCLSEEVRVSHDRVVFQADKVFLGEDVNTIETVFNKYLAITSTPLDKALLNKKYYKFSFKEEVNTTIVEVNRVIKGGGGEFIIDKKSNTITSFALTK